MRLRAGRVYHRRQDYLYKFDTCFRDFSDPAKLVSFKYTTATSGARVLKYPADATCSGAPATADINVGACVDQARVATCARTRKFLLESSLL